MLPAIPQLAASLAREKYALRGHRLIGDRAVKHLELKALPAVFIFHPFFVPTGYGTQRLAS